jgi:hypothetical protein
MASQIYLAFCLVLFLQNVATGFSKVEAEADVLKESGNGAEHRPYQEASQFCWNKPEIKYSSEEFKSRLIQNCIKAVLKEQVRTFLLLTSVVIITHYLNLGTQFNTTDSSVPKNIKNQAQSLTFDNIRSNNF